MSKASTYRLSVVLLLAAVIAPAVTVAQESRVFVTSEAFDGNLGGLTGADEKCNRLATNAALGGVWVAWLSDTNTDAVGRLTPSSGPFVRAFDGTVIANDLGDLSDASIANTIALDENGNGGGRFPWTGTLSNGGKASQRCLDWTSNTIDDRGIVGDYGMLDGTWTQRDIAQSCSGPQTLYCFELTPAGVPADPPWQAVLLALGMLLLVVARYRRRITAR